MFRQIHKSAALVLFVVANFVSLSAQADISKTNEKITLSKDEVTQAVIDLRDRKEFVRARALSTLSNSSNDLEAVVRRELESEDPIRIRAALSVVRQRPEYDESVDFLALLASEDSILISDAVKTLHTLGIQTLSNVRSKLDEDTTLDAEQRHRVAKRLTTESRYAVSYALVAHASAPGHFQGQYENLYNGGQWIDSVLGDLVMLNEGVAKPMQRASKDFAVFARSSDDVDANFARLLAFSFQIKTVVEALAGRDNTNVEDTPYRYAIQIVERVRNHAARALGSSSNAEGALATLKAAHDKIKEREPTEFTRDISLLEEIELSMACLGNADALQLRIAALRLVKGIQDTVEISDDVVATQAFVADRIIDNDLHPNVRKKIAYLYLRSGQVDEAIVEFTMLMGQIERNLAQYGDDISIVTYNFACAYARKGILDESFFRLKQAVSYGYDTYRHFEWMLSDGDLDALRQTESFARWYPTVAPAFLAREYEEAYPVLAERVRESAK